jgi:hypothetical protein
MPNTASIISTVASEFSLFLQDCKQQSYDFDIEIRSAGDEKLTFVKLLLAGEGLGVWLNGASYNEITRKEAEHQLYRAIRDLPVVRNAIRDINARADRHRYDADI